MKNKKTKVKANKIGWFTVFKNNKIVKVILKVLKRTLKSFLIIYTILNIGILAFEMAMYNKVLKEEVVPIIQGEITEDLKENEAQAQESYKSNYGEDAPVTLLAYMQGYFLGQSNIIELQQRMLVFGVEFGIVCAIGYTFYEYSKKKTKKEEAKGE